MAADKYKMLLILLRALELWKGRNDYCHNGTQLNPMQTIQMVRTLCTKFLTVNSKRAEQATQSHQSLVNRGCDWRIWRPPPSNQVKFNSDASYNADTGKGHAGIIARNEEGHLISAAAKRIFATSPLMAEAIALREAIFHARSLNINCAIFESDNQALIEICRGNKQRRELEAIIADIMLLKNQFMHIGFTWTKREGNTVAHTIADLATRGGLVGAWQANPPDELRLALVNDMQALWSA